MKLIHGLWLILTIWGMQIATRILVVARGGQIPTELVTPLTILTLILYLGFGLAALFIAYSGQMQVRDRAVLLLLGAALLVAGVSTLLTSLTLFWWVRSPGLERTVLALGVVITAVQIFAACVLGFKGTASTATRLLILAIPALYAIVVVRDLQAAPNLGGLAVLVISLAMLFATYRVFPNRAWQT